MMNLRGKIISIFFIFTLMGCAAPASTPTAALTPLPPSETPTKLSLPTKAFPTNTPLPCPPHIDTQRPEPDLPENYIGKIYARGLPDGLRVIGNKTIDNSNYEYGLTFITGDITDELTKQNIILFEHLICRDNFGNGYFEIIDVFVLWPELGPFMEWENEAECTLSRIKDPEILPLVMKGNVVERAWRANRRTGKFEEIPITGIECIGFQGESNP